MITIEDLRELPPSSGLFDLAYRLWPDEVALLTAWHAEAILRGLPREPPTVTMRRCVVLDEALAGFRLPRRQERAA